jgi:hypothetical protein
VEVDVGASAAADVAGAVAGAVVGVVAGDSAVVGARADVGVAALGRDVAGATEVGVRAVVGVAAVVRGGRVGAVAVTLGDSVALGAGRVPVRSVVGRVADSLPPPAPQPLSPKTRPSMRAASNHALAARRPRTKGPTRRSLLAGVTRRDIIHQDVRIDDHLRFSQGRRGEHARHAMPAILRPEVRPRHHPKRVRTRFLMARASICAAQVEPTARNGSQRPTLMPPPIRSCTEVVGGVRE